MKLFATTIAAALLGTAAMAAPAGYALSDREQDMRLDTSISAEAYADGPQIEADATASTRYNDLRLDTSADTKVTDGVISTRNDARSVTEGYIYGGR